MVNSLQSSFSNAAPVVTSNISAMPDADQAAGAIQSMQHDASARKVEGTAASGQARQAEGQAAGELAQAQKDVAAHESLADTVGLDVVAAMAVAAGVPGAGLLAAGAAVTTIGHVVHDRLGTNKGEESGSDHEGPMDADEWLFSSRQHKMKMESDQNGAGAAPAPGKYDGEYVRRIDMPIGPLSPDAANTVNAGGISYFEDVADMNPCGGAAPSGNQEEAMARVKIAEDSLAGVTQLKMSSGMMCEAAFGFAEHQRHQYNPEDPHAEYDPGSIFYQPRAFEQFG